MRARAELTIGRAQRGGIWRTTITRLRSDGPVVLRPTIAPRADPFPGWNLGGLGAAWVSRAAGAAGPLGGDDLRLDVRVGAGAALILRDVSASLVLPGPHREGSTSRVAVRVCAGATFVWLPQPLIAAHGCRHRALTSVAMEPGARLLVREGLLLGRFGEEPGSVRQRLRVCIGDHPLYDQEIAIGPEAPGWEAAAVTAGRRAIGSALVVDPGWMQQTPAITWQSGEAVVMPLPGPAVLISALAPDALGLRRALDAGTTVLGGSTTVPGAEEEDSPPSRTGH